MKVMFYLEHFLPQSQTFVANQLEYFGKNHDLEILTQTVDEESKALPNLSVISSNKLNHRIVLGLHRRGFYYLATLFYKFKIRRNINQIKPDVIICHFGPNAIDLFEAKINIPTIVFIHGYDGSQLLRQSKNYANYLLEISKKSNFRLLFVSEFLLGQTLQILPQLKADVFHLGIPPYARTKKSMSEIIKITQIGRLVEKKGIGLTIKSVLRLFELHPELKQIVQVDIIGEGPLYDELFKFIQSNQLENNIHLLGQLDHESSLKILSNSQIYLHPSIIDHENNSEGLCIAVMEAILFQNYVITTPYSGVSELFENQDSLITFCEPDVEKISNVLYETIVQKRYEIKPNDFIIEHFNFENQMEKLEQLMENFERAH
ncbi:MAG: glycosyltransferase [Saprospiraceae bacterium]